MNSLRKYLLSAFAAMTLSLTLANATALAYCPEVDETDEYVCFNTGEDEYYCFYECFCKVERVCGVVRTWSNNGTDAEERIYSTDDR